MSAKDDLLRAIEAHVEAHGAPVTIAELVALTCFSVIAWHGLTRDDGMSEHGEEACVRMTLAVEQLVERCYARKASRWN